MPTVDFSQFFYYPALSSSPGEHIGYRQLSNDDKQQLLPIFELSQRGEETDLNGPAADIRESTVGRTFILDLSKEPLRPPVLPANPRNPEEAQTRFAQATEIANRFNGFLSGLVNPADGFLAWRQFVATFPNAVPVIQFTDPVAQARQILRQAALLSRGGQSVAVRITQDHSEAICPIISQIVSVLNSPDQLLIIIDCGYARRNSSRLAEFATQSIGRILVDLDILEVPLVRAVCMSSSFPRPNHDGSHEYPNFEWDVWREAREAFAFLYGDYAATFRFRRTGFTPFDWRATVVFPLEESWLIYRDVNARDEQGWCNGAEIVSADPRFATAPDIWGTRVIRQGATGRLDGINTAKFWYGAKVNIHIHRQIEYARNIITNYGDGGEEPPEP